MGARCTRAHRADYRVLDYVCVKRKVKRRRRYVLRRASLAQRRHGDYLDLPPSGRPTLRQAKWAFDATVHPLPGVRTPRGAVGPTRDGTAAIKWLTRYRGRLSRRQRAILARVLHSHGRGVKVTARAAAVSAGDQAIFDQAESRLQAHGLRFDHPVLLFDTPEEKASEPAHAVATWWEGEKPGACEITLRPGFGALSLAGRRQTAVHELMHCAIAELVPSAAAWHALPPYFDEGFPEWASWRVGVEWNGSINDAIFAKYLANPEVGLFSRAYTAAGWWSLVEHRGVNLWALLPALAGNPAGRLPFATAEAAGGGAALEADWGSTLATDPGLGARWDLDGPGMPRRAEPRDAVTEDVAFSHPVNEGGAYEARLDIDADVLEVRTHSTQGWLRDGAGTDRRLADETLCAKEGGCECPDGTKLPFDQIRAGAGRVGFSQTNRTADPTIEGVSLDEYCKSPPPMGIQLRRSVGAGEAVVATFLSGTCTVSKGVFTAHATDSGYTLDVRINAFGGYGKTYQIPFGGPDPTFTIDGPGGPFSSLNHPPEYPPSGGAIVLDDKGTRMSLGFIATFNADYSDGVMPVGAMTCKKPRK